MQIQQQEVIGERFWNNNDWSKYEYKATTEVLKGYIIGENVTSDKFGNKELPIITEKPGTKGSNRFYVMALEDFDDNIYYWYRNATYDKVIDVVKKVPMK